VLWTLPPAPDVVHQIQKKQFVITLTSKEGEVKMSHEDLSEAFSYESDIQEKYREKIEAHAFRSLCRHLQERSDLVSNMDLMSTGGFCRNCLAKWLVLAARDLSEQIQESKTPKTSHDVSSINTLDSFEYKKAAKVVYGCSYDEWKSRHLKKASGDQMYVCLRNSYCIVIGKSKKNTCLIRLYYSFFM